MIHSLYSSPNTARVIELRRMRWARLGKRKNTVSIFVGRSEEWGRPFGRFGINGRIILEDK
jgi:hypothetical protein